MSPNEVITVLISGTVAAAGVSAVVTTWLARAKSCQEERARVRTIYAEAFEAVAAYREMPYAIRRRRPDDEAGERNRLSEEMRAIQRRLSYYRAWIRAESDTVGHAYQALLDQLRTTAGQAAHQAWADPPGQSDNQMNIPRSRIDLTPIDALEDTYIVAARRDIQSRGPWSSLFRRR